MIIDELKNIEKYKKLHPSFETVIDFLKNSDLTKLREGTSDIIGREIYINRDEYKTKDIKETNPEAHRKYIDIQTVLTGHEKIGYLPYESAEPYRTYDSERDVEFLKGECEYFKAYPGRFFIFFPQDVHHPCISDGEQSDVTKAVIKIKI